MKAKREYLDYCNDIQEALEKIKNFIAGLDFEGFAKDDKTTFAVIRALEIIGEAARKVPKSIRSRYPEVPWQDMAGMRDKLSHDCCAGSTQKKAQPAGYAKDLSLVPKAGF